MLATAARTRTLLILASFSAIYIGWGTTYLANHFLLRELPPFAIATLRFLFAGSLALTWVLLSGQCRARRSDWVGALIGGVLMITVGQGALLYANQYLPTGLLAMLYTTLPLWSVALEWLLGDRPPPWVLCGLVLASAGVVLLMSKGLGSAATPQQWLAGSLVVASTLVWALGAWWLRRRAPFSSAWLGLTAQMLIGAALLGLIGLGHGDWQQVRLADLSQDGWLWLAYLAIPVSLGVFPAYFWLLREIRPSLVSTFAFVNPMIALLLGFLLLDESLSLSALAACLVTLCGVTLIIFGRR
ncbi:MAG: EamA family transporter [Pseudomonadota bacterium]